MRKLYATITLVALPLAPTLPLSCGGGGGGPARNASYAGDGVTEFGPASAGVSGKLQWGKTYSAHYVDTTDRQNCRWSLYSISKQGNHELVMMAKGNYFNAKINVGQQFTKRVYLKSLECGLWKP